jgi:hypothetical protein
MVIAVHAKFLVVLFLVAITSAAKIKIHFSVDIQMFKSKNIFFKVKTCISFYVGYSNLECQRLRFGWYFTVLS